MRGQLTLKVRSTPTPLRSAPDRDRAGDAAAAQAHDGALEDLDALAVALDDLGRHAHGVAGGELGQVGADLVGDDVVENGHGLLSLVLAAGPREGARARPRASGGSAAEYSSRRWSRRAVALSPTSGGRRSEQVGAVAPRSLERLLAAPASRPRRGRPLTRTSGTPHAAELRRARVLRVLEQPLRERLLDRGGLVDGAREQAQRRHR